MHFYHHLDHYSSPVFNSPPYMPVVTPPIEEEHQHQQHLTTPPCKLEPILSPPLSRFNTPSTPDHNRQITPVETVDRMCFLDINSNVFEDIRHQHPRFYQDVLWLCCLLGLRAPRRNARRANIITLYNSINTQLGSSPGPERWCPSEHCFIRLTYWLNPLEL